MNTNSRAYFLLFFLMSALPKAFGQDTQMTTYCNPLNLDYTYMIYDAYKGISYRSGADPAVVEFRGAYYMFVTRSLGYWHSTDLLNWDFITPEKWYFQGSNAPAAFNYKDSVLYVTGDPSGSMSILYTDNPKAGDWKAVPAILTNLQEDGLMYSNTSFGDYPHFAPAIPGKAGQFTGWMLLSYKKPVITSSAIDSFGAENLVDEMVKTFWVAAKNNDQQWVEIDLLKPAKVYAIQVNYNDYQSDLYGKIPGLYHRYTIEGSLDGKNWSRLVDRENNYKDVPNDYVELATPQSVRYIRYNHIHAPMPHLSISDLRVFGVGTGKSPAKVKGLRVERAGDRRDARISWEEQPNCQGFNVLWGIAPDKLYNSWLVYDANELDLKSLGVDQTYYFSVQAFNENGVSAKSNVVRVD